MKLNFRNTDSTTTTQVLNNKEIKTSKKILRDPIFTRFFQPFGLKQHIYFRIFYLQAHAFALYYSYLFLMGRVERTIYLFHVIYGYASGLGITVGCHRLWTHKTFKANVALQILLMIFQTIAFQFPIHMWSLNHRIHHKFTDTNSDPHNSKRGLLFSHIGWKMLPKHPDYQKKLDTFPMPDLENDPVVRFQSKYYWTLVLIFRYAIPILVFCYIYELSFLHAVACNYAYFCVSIHVTFTVNSIAHKWGDKPYDRNISSVENAIVALFAAGEGWHNYHHTFPWDYKASEFGWKLNLSTMFVDFFAWIGWAWDLKTVPEQILKERQLRTGSGFISHGDTDDNTAEIMKSETNHVWGWDDLSMPRELRDLTRILNPLK